VGHPLDARLWLFTGPRINAVGRLGDPSWWWSCSPPQTTNGPWSWPRRCESAQTGKRRELCDADRGRKRVALGERTPGADPAFCCWPSHWHQGMIGVVAPAAWNGSACRWLCWQGESATDACAPRSAPRGLWLWTGPCSHCPSALLVGHGRFTRGRWLHRAGETVAALPFRPSRAGKVDWLKGRSSGCPGGARKPGLSDGSLPISWRNLQRLEPLGAGLAVPVFWLCRLQGHRQRLLVAAICINLEQGECRSAGDCLRWQVNAPCSIYTGGCSLSR